MGLFGGYFDPQRFGEGGGLPGRLLALQQQQGLYQPGAGLDQPPSVPQTPIRQPMSWPNLSGSGQSSSDLQTAASSFASQYQALRQVFGDHGAMLATLDPEVGKTLIAQALGKEQKSGSAGLTAGEAPVQIPAADVASPSALLQPAQFVPFFARPPIWIPRQLTPLNELPPGSANGSRSGMPFPRNMGKPQTPDEYPRCTYCSDETSRGNFHRDHVIPRSRSGDGSERNWAPSCRNCNLGKGDKTPEEWYNWLKNGGV
jgi:hypothetical protein